MAEATDAREQRNLPFPEGEASHAERWNDIVLALSRIGTKCDLYLSRFVRLVFDTTHGGTSGAFIKSYEALAERPLWLCCSPRKVRLTVELADRLGLIGVQRRRSWQGGQLDNAYSINWAGVRSIILDERAGGTSCQGGGTTCQALGTSCHHIRNRSTLEDKFRYRSGADGTSCHRAEFEGVGRRRGDLSLSAVLCRQSPILTAAGQRRTAPLAATEEMLHGVYAPLKERHLHDPLRLVKWFRMQLSTIRPVMGDTEADLLLTLATALYATSLPEQEVARNRVAAFVGTMLRRRWTRALPFVPQARALLDEGIAGRGAAWAGLADETVEVAEKAGAAG